MSKENFESNAYLFIVGCALLSVDKLRVICPRSFGIVHLWNRWSSAEVIIGWGSEKQYGVEAVSTCCLVLSAFFIHFKSYGSKCSLA